MKKEKGHNARERQWFLPHLCCRSGAKEVQIERGVIELKLLLFSQVPASWSQAPPLMVLVFMKLEMDL
jgi:hypothetical protein